MSAALNVRFHEHLVSPDEIKAVESAVGIELPMPYRLALESSGLLGEDDDHPQFITEAALLVSENKHFSFNPDDLADLQRPGVLGALKFFLLYGSRERFMARRRKWHEDWALGQRFIIGSDLGEEQFYIVLSEASPRVYCYELETQKSREVAPSVSDWLAEVKRTAGDHE